MPDSDAKQVHVVECFILLTRMSLVVFQHVDLLGKLAVTLLALVLFDALVKLHVVPQSVLGLHACTGKHLVDMAPIQTSATVCYLSCRKSNEACDAAARA